VDLEDYLVRYSTLLLLLCCSVTCKMINCSSVFQCVVHRMARLGECHLIALLLLELSVLTEAMNPGLKVQLSQTGLNYAASVAVDILTVQVQQATLPDQSGTADVTVGKVEYEITNMKVKLAI